MGKIKTASPQSGGVFYFGKFRFLRKLFRYRALYIIICFFTKIYLFGGRLYDIIKYGYEENMKKIDSKKFASVICNSCMRKLCRL